MGDSAGDRLLRSGYERRETQKARSEENRLRYGTEKGVVGEFKKMEIKGPTCVGKHCI